MLKALLLVLLFVALSTAKPKPVIIDTDLDIDDVGAIMYLVKNPNVVVKGITVAGNGFSDPIFGVPNMLYVLEQLGCSNYQVAYGESISATMLNPTGPAVGNPVPSFIRTGIDYYFSKCLNKSIPIDEEASPLDAVSLIISVLENSPEPVDFLLLGSATNLAKAFITNPSIKKNVGTLYFSGGNFDLEGTPIVTGATFPYTNKNKGSSWNFFLDPLAAERLFNSGIDMYMMTSQAQNDLTFNSTQRDFFGSKYGISPFILDTLFSFAVCGNQTDADIQWWDESAAVFMVELQQNNFSTICTQWENFTDPYVSLVDGGAFGRTLNSLRNSTLPGVGPKIYTCQHALLPKFYDLYMPVLDYPTICPPLTPLAPPLTVDDLNVQVQQQKQTINSLVAQQQQLQQIVLQLQQQINTLTNNNNGDKANTVNINFANILAR